VRLATKDRVAVGRPAFFAAFNVTAPAVAERASASGGGAVGYGDCGAPMTRPRS
jgi:hypothetical protein